MTKSNPVLEWIIGLFILLLIIASISIRCINPEYSETQVIIKMFYGGYSPE